MIKRKVTVVPRWAWIIAVHLNNKVPGGNIHDLGSGTDRDINNLLDTVGPQLEFLPKEIKRGKEFLLGLGIPAGAPFVCLNIRDSKYLASMYPVNDWNYHDYRDSSLENYVLAAEELSNRGYYVLRMGAIVEKPFLSENPMIIDYATNGMRSEFLDIFLGATCAFCISSGTGFDAIPYSFRRPLAYVNFAPVGILNTFSSRFVLLSRQHYSVETGLKLTLKEILESGAAFVTESSHFVDLGIELRENTPEQILDAVLEIADRIEGKWIDTSQSQENQLTFREIFQSHLSADERGLHGVIKAHYSAKELSANPSWLNLT
jgi:putative glycosyltransferase (TIGR04372 family)